MKPPPLRLYVHMTNNVVLACMASKNALLEKRPVHPNNKDRLGRKDWKNA